MEGDLDGLLDAGDFDGERDGLPEEGDADGMEDEGEALGVLVLDCTRHMSIVMYGTAMLPVCTTGPGVGDGLTVYE